MFDSENLCPLLTEAELMQLNELKAGSSQRMKPDADRVRTEFIEKRAAELVARGVPPPTAKEAIERQCGGELLSDVVLPFDDPELQGCTVGDVLADPDRFKGRRLADPVEGVGYGRGKAQVLRNKEGRLFIKSFAHGGMNYTLHAVKQMFGKVVENLAAQAGATLKFPEIEVRDGFLPQAVDQAEAALLANGNRFQIYQHAGSLVRPVLETVDAVNNQKTKAYRLNQITVPYLCDALNRSANFFRYDGRRRRFVRKDCPRQVAEMILSRVGEWRAPILNGVVTTPFLRRDGSLCETPGYDAASGLLFLPGDEVFPPIPQQPTKQDALRALNILWQPLCKFPFATAADAGVALSGILTTLIRRSLDTAPLHAKTAPIAGSGKTKIVDIASILATGYPAAVLATGRTLEELGKRIDAALIGGQAIICLDNIEYPLESEALCQMLTQTRYEARVLGQSKNVSVKVGATVFATGNNLVVVGDLTRRSVVGLIDPKCERPELRVFEGNLLETVSAERGELVVAAITILRARHLARLRGERVNTTPLGSFEQWSEWVRDALVWLWPNADPVATMDRLRESDPKLNALRTIVGLWRAHLGIGIGHAYTAQEIAVKAGSILDLRNALIGLVPGKRSGEN